MPPGKTAAQTAHAAKDRKQAAAPCSHPRGLSYPLDGRPAGVTRPDSTHPEQHPSKGSVVKNRARAMLLTILTSAFVFSAATVAEAASKRWNP